MAYNGGMLWVLLPLAVLVLFIAWARAKVGGLREGVLIGAGVWGAVLVVITEALSLVKSITWGGLVTAWLVAGVVAWFGFVLARQKPMVVEASTKGDRLDAFSKILVACLAAFAGVLLCIALVAPPNTWDAMTYHMGRVIHWAQNHSVAHYPTNILRQVHLNPGAEFIILHFQILTNGDRFANLPQWLAMVGSVVGASLIAARLGAGIAGQVVASTACTTLPMGILQSTSAQNDYVAAFWLACLAWGILEFVRQPVGKRLTRLTYFIGLVLGMAMLTKATAYLFAAPLCLWYGVHVMRTRAAQWWRHVGAVAAMVIALNAGHGWRNYGVFGSPLGPKEEVGHYSNATMGPMLLASNAMRNLSLHANSAPSGLQRPFTNLVAKAHSIAGLDPHDPRTTLSDTYFGVEELPNHEDSAGNGLHLMVILASMAFLFRRGYELRGQNIAMGIVVAGGFILFCGYLRWQPWHSRLHLPLFVLASPLVGSAWSNQLKLGRLLCATLMLAGMYPLFFNFSRPIVGENSIFRIARSDVFYLTRRDVREGHMHLADYARRRGCLRVGMMIGANEWEYPLWAMLNESRVDGPYKFDHVNVTNATRDLPGGEHLDPKSPECITSMQVREASEIYGKAKQPGS